MEKVHSLSVVFFWNQFRELGEGCLCSVLELLRPQLIYLFSPLCCAYQRVKVCMIDDTMFVTTFNTLDIVLIEQFPYLPYSIFAKPLSKLG